MQAITESQLAYARALVSDLEKRGEVYSASIVKLLIELAPQLVAAGRETLTK